jgi:UDP-N-acetylglucosamine 1-carboxyvinyltransferase
MPFDTLHEPFEVLDPGVPRTMEKFIIEGGQPLSGTIVPAGNKNAALPALAATLLTEEEVVLHNIPRIRDVEAMIDLLRGLGATAEWRDGGAVALCAAGVRGTELDPGLSERIRASFLLAARPRCRRRAAT